MDILTHALAGSAVADALPFTRRLGPAAGVAAAAAGMVPDLDLLPAFIANFPPKSLSFGGLFDIGLAQRLHRGYTHSFPVMFVAALIFGFALWRFLGRRGAAREWMLLLFLCLVSHSLLDLTNRWGVKLWLPFSDTVSSLGLLPLVDRFVLGVLAATFIINHVLRNGHEAPRTSSSLLGRVQERTAGAAGRFPHVAAIGNVCLVLVLARVALRAMGTF